MPTITTHRPRVAWGWILLMAVPAGMYAFVEKCSGTALIFTLKKYIHDPQWLAFLTSINILFGIVVAPAAAWMSDHTQSRLGRRKPWMIAGLSLLALCLILLPSAQTLWLVVLIVVVYQFSIDVGFTGLWNPLYADLVPDAQRGRGMVVNRYLALAARMVFMFFLIGQFDAQYGTGRGAMKSTAAQPGMGRGMGRHSLPAATAAPADGLTGEQIIYYSAAVLVVLTILILLFWVRESPHPAPGVRTGRFSPAGFLRALWSTPPVRRLYVWVIASTLMTLKLGGFHPLLLTEQFHFSKQVMGNIHTATMAINMGLILPLGAALVDRFNRKIIFIACLTISTLHPLAVWILFQHCGFTPAPRLFIGLHVLDAAADNLGLIALWPLLFAAVPAERRGAAQAGFLIAGGMASFLLTNLMGWWIKAFSPGESGSYDYLNGYLLIFIAGIAACMALAVDGLIPNNDRQPGPALPRGVGGKALGAPSPGQHF